MKLDNAMQGRRLFVDSIPDDFDPGKDIALSPSCFLGREHIWPEWDLSAFEDPLADPDRRWRDWVRTRLLANRLSRQLGESLNRRHGTSYGHRFWRELTILWLLLLIQSAWLRYLQIGKAIEKWGETPLEVPVAANVGEWIFSDDLDFYHNGPKNKDYELWVAKLILEGRAPEKWRLTPTRDVSFRSTNGQIESSVAKSPARGLIEWAMPRRAVYNLTGAGRIEWFLSALVPLLPKRPQVLIPTIDELPASGDDGKFPDDFLEIVNTLVGKTRPQTLDTDFARYNDRAARLPYKPGRIFVSGASEFVAENRFQFAHALEAGERVYRYQHGAGYGLAHIMNQHEIEYFYHGFISWGWRQDGRVAKPAVALPAPHLSRMRGRRSRRSDDIIFVGTNMELVPYPFKQGPQQGGVLDYRRRKIRFINSLPPSARSNLKYRPNLHAASDIADLEFVEKHTGAIDKITGPLDPHLFACALAVFDYPSTAMYHSFAANVPTLLTWDRKAWPEHERGAEQYDLLARAGILMESPEEAAEKVGRISGATDHWWQSEDVQNARREWCSENAMTGKSWLADWVRALAAVS